jgi:hypothetical protein
MGNVKFDLSQFYAALPGSKEADWKPLAKEAADLFVRARCPTADIRNALSQHPHKEAIKDVIDAADPPAAAAAPKAEEGKKGGVGALPAKKQ